MIVTQVKSYRVVYFTDDSAYEPPMQGDWYFASQYEGALPKGMTLRNCWRWRFNGHRFIDAGPGGEVKGPQRLLVRNKEALLALLREKIEALQAPWLPSTPAGAEARTAKLREATAYLGGATAEAAVWLVGVASARNITLHEAANLVVNRHAACERALCECERLREMFATAIREANSQEELVVLRNRLVDELAPEVGASFGPADDDTEPPSTAAPCSEEVLEQERFRLRIQLRERVNQLRRPFVSDYLLDDVILRHKGRVAHAVLQSGGTVPSGLDAGVLLDYAKSRDITVLDAAKEVMLEMSETAEILLRTEAMKDRLLAAIRQVSDLSGVRALGREIAGLSLEKVA